MAEPGVRRARDRSNLKFLAIDPCIVCGFEGRGFGFQLHLSPVNPAYDFCSVYCQSAGQDIAVQNNGKIEGTKMLSDIEERAITDARTQFADALERHGLLEPFGNCTGADIDDIIRSTIIGFQASVQRAYGRGEVPF